MKIAVGSDHAGFVLKQEVALHLSRIGHTLVDLGAYKAEPSDYPDFAAVVGKALMAGTSRTGHPHPRFRCRRLCRRQQMPGIRAAICHDTYSAHQGVEHDDMNILVMGSRIVGSAVALD